MLFLLLEAQSYAQLDPTREKEAFHSTSFYPPTVIYGDTPEVNFATKRIFAATKFPVKGCHRGNCHRQILRGVAVAPVAEHSHRISLACLGKVFVANVFLIWRTGGISNLKTLKDFQKVAQQLSLQHNLSWRTNRRLFVLWQNFGWNRGQVGFFLPIRWERFQS